VLDLLDHLVAAGLTPAASGSKPVVFGLTPEELVHPDRPEVAEAFGCSLVASGLTLVVFGWKLGVSDRLVHLVLVDHLVPVDHLGLVVFLVLAVCLGLVVYLVPVDPVGQAVVAEVAEVVVAAVAAVEVVVVEV